MKQHYFEFDDHEYYGLIAVNMEEEDRNEPHEKAIEIYVSEIAGVCFYSVSEEGKPEQITKEQAFMKFMYAPNHEDNDVKTLIKQFEEMENGVLLIDGSLI